MDYDALVGDARTIASRWCCPRVGMTTCRRGIPLVVEKARAAGMRKGGGDEKRRGGE